MQGTNSRAPYRTIDMAQQNESQGRSIDMKTLALAAIAAMTAAVVTSLFWQKGTLISTALTPVIVALTQELLRRPADKITGAASKVTVAPARGVAALAGAGARGTPDESRFDERRLREREHGANGSSNGGAGAALTGAGVVAPPPPLDDTRAPAPAQSEPTGANGTGQGAPSLAPGEVPERRVYGRKRFRWKVALLTGLAAFAIAAVALTASELALGGSVGGDGKTSLFGGGAGGSGTDGADGGGDASDGGSDEAAPTDSSESQAVPDEESGSSVAPPEEPAPVEEEPVEPVEPAPVEPAPTE